MTYEQKQQCKQIFEHYGEDNQLEKAKEELQELIEAIEVYQDDESEPSLLHLAEEMADVRIMLRQLRQLRGVVGEQVDEFVQFKLDRQLKRIANEQKNKHYD